MKLQELTIDESEQVNGGTIWVSVIAFTTVAVTIGAALEMANDFYEGYTENRR